MNDTLLVLACWLLFGSQALAQQLPLLTQFQERIGVLNPAALPTQYLRYEHNLAFGATHHSQWTGVEGGPVTSQVAGSMLFDDYGPLVPLAGGYFVNDRTGPSGFSGVYAKLGGILSDDPYERGVGMAFQLGLNQYRLRFSELELRDEELTYNADDDGRLFPDAGVGLFAYTRSGVHVLSGGLSVPQVLGLDLRFRGSDGEVVTQRYRHYFAHAAYLLELPRDGYFEATAWVKVVPQAATNVSLGVRYQTPTSLYLGAGLTSSRMLSADLGVALGERGGDRAARIGYGFAQSFTRFGPYVGATHELNLSFTLSR